MKGQMKVKKLNDTGLYISEMDWDNTYICKENPIGNFVMVIEPLSGFDGGIIYFDKKTDVFIRKKDGKCQLYLNRPQNLFGYSPLMWESSIYKRAWHRCT